MILVRRLVEVYDKEETEPGTGVRRDVVNDFKQGGECAVDFGRNLIHHARGMLDGVEPVAPRYLFFLQIRAGHGRNGTPFTLGEAF